MGTCSESKQQSKVKLRNFLLSGFFGVAFLVAVFSIFLFSQFAVAAPAPTVITYQGKLLVSGTAATTTLPMKFVIYTSLTGGTAVYTASGTLPSTSSVSITPASGLFSVDLGGNGTNSIDPSIFQNNSNLYLEVTINGQTMSPRKRLTTAPYAFNSKYLDGISATSTASTSTYIPVSDLSGNFNFNHVTSTGIYNGGNLNVMGNSALATTTVSGYLGVGTDQPITGLSLSGESNDLGEWGKSVISDSCFGEFCSAALMFVHARGTRVSPTSTQEGDSLGSVTASGYTAGGYQVSASIAFTATEDFSFDGVTSTHAGSKISMSTVANGSLGALVERMTVDQSGYVGIGTSTPSAKLTVVDGSVVFSGEYLSDLNVPVSGTGTRMTWMPNLSAFRVGTVDGDHWDGGEAGAYNLGNIGIMSSVVGGYDGIAAGAFSFVGGGQVNTISSSSASSFIAGGSHNVIGNGYSFIGGGSSNTINSINSFIAGGGNNLAAGAYSFIAGTHNTVNGYSAMALGHDMTVNASSSIGINVGDYTTSFTVNQPYTMAVMGGRMGIGTTSPAALLTVYGDVLFGAGSNTTSYLNFGTSTGTSGYGLRDRAGVIQYKDMGGSWTSLAGNLLPSASDGQTLAYFGGAWTATSAVFINSSTGRVGIGTVVPDTALQVVGNFSNLIVTSSPVRVVGSVAVGTEPLNITISGHYAYVVNEHSDNMSIVDISDPTSPVQVSTTSVGYSPSAVAISGHYAYVANYSSNNISVIDISNPFLPVQVATTSVGSGPSSLVISGHYVYVANYSQFLSEGSLSVVDISNPHLPMQVATLTVGMNPNSLALAENYVYVANMGSDNVWVVDISNPLAPVQISTVTVGDGPLSIAVSGRYAYVANKGSNNLSVVDISNPLSPAQVSTTTVGTNPWSVAVSGRYAYVANHDSNNLSIVDVSNPASPRAAVSPSISGGPAAVAVSGGYAYVVKSISNSLSVVSLTGSEVSSLIAHSAEVGNLQSGLNVVAQGVVSGNSIQVGFGGIFSNGALAVSATNTASYFGGSVGIGTTTPSTLLTVAGTSTLRNILPEMFDANNNVSLYSVGSSSTRFSAGWFNEVYVGSSTWKLNQANGAFHISNVNTATPAVSISDNGMVGIGTNSPSAALQVVGNISNLVTERSGVRAVASSSVGVGPVAAAVSGRYLYTTNMTAGTISVVDISNPLAPSEVASTTVGIWPVAIAISGKYAYVTNASSSDVYAVDISNPLDPTVVATTSVNAFPDAIAISGRYAYVVNSDGASGVSVLDISNPLSMRVVTTTPVGPGPISIAMSGRYAYVSNHLDNTISVLDASNPANLHQVATVSVGVRPRAISIYGHYAFVLNDGGTSFGAGDVSVVDISNPLSPVVKSTVLAGDYFSMSISGRYAYLTGITNNSLVVADITNPISPVRVSSTTVGVAPYAVTVVGRYAYTVNAMSDSVSVIDLTGTEVSTLVAHSAEVGSLQSEKDVTAQGVISAGTSLFVGGGGILSSGAISVVTTNTASYFSGSLGIGTTTPDAKLSVVYDSVGITVSDTMFSAVKNIFNASALDIEGAMRVGTYNQLNFGTSTDVFSTAFLNDGYFNSLVSSNKDLNMTASGIDGLRHDINLYTTTGGGGGNINLLTSGSGFINFGMGNNGGPTGDSPAMRITTSGVGIGTITPASALQVVGKFTNVITASSSISLATTVGLGSSPMQVVVSNQYAYVINLGSRTISILDVSNSSAPQHISTTSIGYNPLAIAVSGRYAYVANREDVSGKGSLLVVDIANKTAPVVIASTSVENNPISVLVSGHYAYVLNSVSSSISVVDISDPHLPKQVTAVAVGNTPYSFSISGNYIYVTNFGSDTMSVVDIANPVKPQVVATPTVGAVLRGMAISGHYAYILSSASPGLIHTFDISNPTSPVSVATTTVANYPHDITISGRYAYVTHWGTVNSVSVFDISDPLALSQLSIVSVGGYPTAPAVSGNNVYTANYASSTMSVLNVFGAEVSSLITHSADVGNLQSRNDVVAQGVVYAGTSLQVGIGGILSTGALAVSATDTPSYFGGSIGIGTTSPSGLLHLYGGSATSTDLFTISTVSGNAFRFNASGTAYASSNWAAGGADYAEYFYTHDTDLVSGEAVCVDVTKSNAVKRCARGEDPDIIGIISTNPSIVGNSKEEYESNPNYKIVGMLGQIPARVSAENGAVRPGDSLTSASSTPGYLMKANAGDPTVGVALEPLDANALTGTVNVLISRRNKSLTVEQIEESVSKRVADMKIEDEVDMMVTNAVRAYDFSTADQLTALVDSKLQLFGDGFKTKLSEDFFVPFGNKLSALSSSTDKLTIRMDTFEESLHTVSTSLALFKDEVASTTNLLWDAINGVSTTVDRLATVVGSMPVSNTSTQLTVSQENNYLVIKNNELNLNGAILAGVLSVSGKNNKWRITDEGVLISVVQTSDGDKDVYAMQSLSSELVFSGSAQLTNGEAEIKFDTSTSDMIDSEQPLKVSITLTSDEAKGIFVKAKSALGFVVKELMSGSSNATFDWVVVAKRGNGMMSAGQAVPDDSTNDSESAVDSTIDNSTSTISDTAVVSTTPEATVDNASTASSTPVLDENSSLEVVSTPTETAPSTTVITSDVGTVEGV